MCSEGLPPRHARSLVFQLLLNALWVFPLALLRHTWLLGWRFPSDPSAWGAVFRFNHGLYQDGLRVAGVALAVQLLAAAGWRVGGDWRTGLARAARVFAPVRWWGCAAIPGLLPLYPLNTLSPLLWLGAVFSVAWRLLDPVPFSGPASGRRTFRLPRHWPWALAGLTLAIHLVPWFNVTWPVMKGNRDYLLTGDQPAYLYMAESLVTDRDLDVSNNTLPPGVYGRTDGKHAGGPRRHNPGLSPSTPKSQRIAGRMGKAWWSTHRCGTSVVIAPPYALGRLLGGWERRLATLLIVMLVALAIRELALGAVALGVGPGLAAGLALVTGVSVPVAGMSTAIFPEPLMFVVMARLVRLCAESRDGLWLDAETGFHMAMAPWLQDKYLLWVFPFFVARMVAKGGRWRSLLALGFLPGISACLMMWNNRFLFDSLFPGKSLGTFLTLRETLLSGVPGSWFDWGYGLILLAPVVLLAAPGFLDMGSSVAPPARRVLWPSLAALAAGNWIIGSWPYWYGAFAPPNRFMLTLLPLCVVPAMAVTAGATGFFRKAAVLLWCYTACLGVETLLNPSRWYSRSHPAAGAVQWLGLDGLAVRFAPFFHGEAALNPGLWIAAAGLLLMLGLALARKPAVLRSPRALGWGVAASVVMACAMAGWQFGPCRLGPSDVLCEAGCIRSPAIATAPDGRPVLTCELDLTQAPRFATLAFAVRPVDAAGRTVGGEDFDVYTYTRDWVKASKANRAYRMRTGLIQVRRELDPPAAAVAVRVGLFVPGSRQSYKPLLRHSTNALRLPSRVEAGIGGRVPQSGAPAPRDEASDDH